jgi:ectoine hydrolase
MDSMGIDLLIVTDPANMFWLTGYDAWSFYVPQAVVIPVSGSPSWFGREMDANGARRTTTLPEQAIFGYPEALVQNPRAHPMTELARVIVAQGHGSGSIGVEKDSSFFSISSFERLAAAAPNASFKDASNLVNWARAVKSPREIEYMKCAGRIVEKMHVEILAKIRPGLRKNELIGAIYEAGLLGVDGKGGDYPAIVPMAPTGVDASAPHLTWDDRPIPPDSGTFFEIAGCYRRYHCPQSRTVYLGRPPDKYRTGEGIILEGIDRVLSFIRPGVTCEEVDNVWRRVLNKYGVQKESRSGYSIGAGYPPDWGEHTMSFRAGDQTQLVEGMAFHFIPALWFEDWGIEISESIVVTPSGCEILSHTPRKLFVK